MRRLPALIVTAVAATFATTASAQVRLATWNITEWGLTTYSPTNLRIQGFQGALFGTFQTRSVKPDLMVLQEVESQAAADVFVTLMNLAPGSPADYARAAFINGPDTDSALIYRTSKFNSVIATIAVPADPNIPRHVIRYDVRLNGYTATAGWLSIYSVHMKAGDSSADEARRLAEAQGIRTNAQGLPAGTNFLLAGDMNVYRSTDNAHEWLLADQANDAGRFFDPISTLGNWNAQSSFRYVHTQSPLAGTFGGMDDRFDQILAGSALLDGAGMDYLGFYPTPYSTSTWNDGNHTYRAWGNDGSQACCNDPMRIAGNAMVGDAIAQAIVNSMSGTNSAPHLCILLDLKAPPRITLSTTAIDFGTVLRASVATAPLMITNTADVALWSRDGTGNGIDNLTYTFASPAGFTAPAGTHAEPAGGGANTHSISLLTAAAGPRAGALTINSDDPNTPARTVNLTGMVLDADVNADTAVTIEDLYAWHTTAIDADGSGAINPADARAIQTWLRQVEGVDVVNGRR